jgi:hypothetical protein
LRSGIDALIKIYIRLHDDPSLVAACTPSTSIIFGVSSLLMYRNRADSRREKSKGQGSQGGIKRAEEE